MSTDRFNVTEYSEKLIDKRYDADAEKRFEAIIEAIESEQREPTDAELADLITIAQGTNWDEDETVHAEVNRLADALKSYCEKHGLPFVVMVQTGGTVHASPEDGISAACKMLLAMSSSGRHPRSLHRYIDGTIQAVKLSGDVDRAREQDAARRAQN